MEKTLSHIFTGTENTDQALDQPLWREVIIPSIKLLQKGTLFLFQLKIGQTGKPYQA
jgi:hypothetical protein